MIEFAPGYLQGRVPHLTRNYFPIATREPTQDMYESGARRNPAADPEVIRQQQLGRDVFAFFALSELALLASAAFGKKENVGKFRQQLNSRHVVRKMAEGLRLPYTMPSINLL